MSTSMNPVAPWKIHLLQQEQVQNYQHLGGKGSCNLDINGGEPKNTKNSRTLSMVNPYPVGNDLQNLKLRSYKCFIKGGKSEMGPQGMGCQK